MNTDPQVRANLIKEVLELAEVARACGELCAASILFGLAAALCEYQDRELAVIVASFGTARLMAISELKTAREE